jgi:hypothetical protein
MAGLSAEFCVIVALCFRKYLEPIGLSNGDVCFLCPLGTEFLNIIDKLQALTCESSRFRSARSRLSLSYSKFHVALLA